MKVKLLEPMIYQGHLYRQGVVVEVDPLEGARWVHEKKAVPELDTRRQKTIGPPETRQNPS